MNIQDALKETEIVIPDYVNSKKESYAKLFDGILYWYNVEKDEYTLPVTLQGINNINWQPYHPKEEIRPSEAGELWSHPNGNYFMTYHVEDELYCRNKHGIESLIADSLNLDKWKRLHPPVNDEEVIVIEGVRWASEDGFAVPSGRGKDRNFHWCSLIDKPPMTMTLTIPKER